MKHTYFLLSALLLGAACNKNKEEANQVITLQNHPVIITEVREGKYTVVYGEFNYRGSTHQIHSNDGYYYKQYKLKPGDIIKVDLTLYVYRDFKKLDNPYDDVIEIEAEDMLLTSHELP